jgi:hypothetical protein
MKTPQPLSLRVGLFIACLATTSCTLERYADDDNVIYSLSPATWFEDGWSYYEISQDEKRALFGARFGFRLIDLERDREDPTAFAADLDRVRAATFYGEGRLARLGVREGSTGWFLEGPQGPVRSALPSDATPNWSPDGGMVAYYRAAEAGLFVGTPDEADFLDVGGFVTGVAWAPPGDVVYALVDHDDGVSSLVQVEVPGREMTTIKEGLDATNRYNSIGPGRDQPLQLNRCICGRRIPLPSPCRSRATGSRGSASTGCRPGHGHLRVELGNRWASTRRGNGGR